MTAEPSVAELYSEGKSLSELAIIFAVTEKTVTNRLKKTDIIPRRCLCGCGERNPSFRDFVSGHNSRLVDTNAWRKDPIKLKKANNKISKANKGRVPYNKEYIPTRGDLEFLYFERKLSANKIKDIMGVSGPTVKKWFVHYDIKTRGFSESVKNAFDTGVIDKNTNFWRDDIEKAKTANEKISLSNKGRKVHNKIDVPPRKELLDVCTNIPIGEILTFYNISNPTLLKWKHYHKINVTYKHPVVPFSTNNTLIVPREDLQFLYEEKGFTEKHISKIMGVSQSVLSTWMRHYEFHPRLNSGGSFPESTLSEFILSITKNVILRDRLLINPTEIDILIPDHNIAIEMNGIYWHSEEKGKDRKYHVSKTNSCEEKGYQLFHIFDIEWFQKQSIWKSVLSSSLGIHQFKIGARSCKVIDISSKDTKSFLDCNHLQGYCQSKVRYGLIYNNEIISIMTFGKSRFNKKYDWELLRFCSKKGYQILGGASKLLTHFRRNHSGTIISYANRRWSTGKLYDVLGFEYTHATDPNYFYWKPGSDNLYSRNKFQKHKLNLLLDNYDDKLTEYENMKINGYDRIWDCGNMVFTLDKI